MTDAGRKPSQENEEHDHHDANQDGNKNSLHAEEFLSNAETARRPLVWRNKLYLVPRLARATTTAPRTSNSGPSHGILKSATRCKLRTAATGAETRIRMPIRRRMLGDT